jgi:hypothetical protein
MLVFFDMIPRSFHYSSPFRMLRIFFPEDSDSRFYRTTQRYIPEESNPHTDQAVRTSVLTY